MRIERHSVGEGSVSDKERKPRHDLVKRINQWDLWRLLEGEGRFGNPLAEFDVWGVQNAKIG